MDDLDRFCCRNPDCPDYGRRGHGNLTACGRYGTRQQYRLSSSPKCLPRHGLKWVQELPS